MKFRKKPVVIDAMQLTVDSFNECCRFIGGENILGAGLHHVGVPYIEIKTLEGGLRARLHDWIIRGVKGEFYPCKPDIFDATYELELVAQEDSQ